MISRVDLLIGLPNCNQIRYAIDTLVGFYAQRWLKSMLLTDLQKELSIVDAEEDVLIVTDPQLCRYEVLIFTEATLYQVLKGPEITRTYFENDPEYAMRNITDDSEKEAIMKLSDEYFTPLNVIRSTKNGI